MEKQTETVMSLRAQAAAELNEEQRKADLAEMKVALREERKAMEVLNRIKQKISKIETNAADNAFS